MLEYADRAETIGHRRRLCSSRFFAVLFNLLFSCPLFHCENPVIFGSRARKVRALQTCVFVQMTRISLLLNGPRPPSNRTSKCVFSRGDVLILMSCLGPKGLGFGFQGLEDLSNDLNPESVLHSGSRVCRDMVLFPS